MHPAPAFLDTDRDRLMRRIEAWPFALVIAVDGNRAHVAHTPVICSGRGSLHFHLAQSNAACRALAKAGRALIVFSGPNDYISPDWYGVANQVPTWNYLSVEAEGPVTPLDETATASFLDALTARFEDGLFPKPEWTRAKMSPERFEAMMRAITAFDLSPERLEGITKIGQNKPAETRKRAGAALKAAGGDPTLSTMMERD